MKINLKRYGKLVDVLEFIYSDIAKNVEGTFFSETFRKSPCLRDCIYTHLHYFKDCKKDGETLVIYVARMLLEKQEVYIWGATVGKSVSELCNNPVYNQYKI